LWKVSPVGRSLKHSLTWKVCNQYRARKAQENASQSTDSEVSLFQRNRCFMYFFRRWSPYWRCIVEPSFLVTVQPPMENCTLAAGSSRRSSHVARHWQVHRWQGRQRQHSTGLGEVNRHSLLSYPDVRRRVTMLGVWLGH
jgi:hypothetical protein